MNAIQNRPITEVKAASTPQTAPAQSVGSFVQSRANRVLGEQYGGEAMGTNIRANYSETLRTPDSERLGMDTPEARFQSLRHAAQMDSSDQTQADSNRCGPSAIVAGMYQANGRQGLTDLISSMQSYNQAHDLGQNVTAGLGDLPARLRNGGNITQNDLNNLQESLYWQLRSRQDSTVDPSGSNNGIHQNVMGDFMSSSPSVHNTLDRAGMNVAFVDTDGVNGSNHYVLEFQHQGRPAIYDPYPISNGGQLDQVTQDPAQIARYRAATSVRGH